MARKVNTKFVIGLSATLVLAGGAYGAFRVISWMQGHNPELFKTRGEEAEKAGNLKAAVDNFSRAAALSSQKHIAGADELFAHTADLAMEISKKAQTQEEALTYYRTAMGCYKQALIENPHNKKVNATFLEEQHQQAMFFPSITTWGALEDVADRLIKKSEDGIQPRLFRAEGRLRRMQLTPKATVSDILTDVDADLQEVLKLKPDSGEAVALRGEVMWFSAKQAAISRGLRVAEDFRKDDKYGPSMNAARTMLEGYIKAHGTHADVANVWANMLLEQFVLMGVDETASPQQKEDDKKAKDAILASAIKTMEEAVEASSTDPSKSFFIDNLGTIYIRNNQPEKAEDLYKRTIARRPEQPEGYFRLADFYRSRVEFAKAVEAYKDVLKHPQIGIGREAVRNESFQFQSVEGIAWCNMELAEQPNLLPAEQKPLLKEAAEYTDKLRTSHAPKGWVEMLDGRAQIINGDLNQSVRTLRLAEADLNGQFVDRFRQVELMLARVNELQGQTGGALEFVDKALAINPNDLGTILRRASLLLQQGRTAEVRSMFDRMLGERKTDPETKLEKYTNEDRYPVAFMESARKLDAIARGDLKQLEGDRAYLTLARAQYNAEDYESAAANATRAIEQVAKSTPAQIQKAYEIAIVANAQLKRQEVAKSLVAEALTKFPTGSGFQALKVQLDLPAGADPIAAQKAIADSLTDDYLKFSSYASIYHQQKVWDDEITTLQKAEALVASPTTRDERDRLSGVIERIFSAAIVAADAAKGTPKKEADYYDIAQKYATKAEKLNLDGTAGLLFRGRLEMVKSNNKTGIDFLRQAVRSQPDYAVAHMVLGQAYLRVAMTNAASANTSSTAAAAVTTNRNAALEEFRQVVRLSPNNTRALQIAVELLVANGDSASLKEAQIDIEHGLRMTPRNPFFMSASEILTSNLLPAIKRREEMLAASPEDLDNRRRLAGLFVRLKDDSATNFAANIEAAIQRRQAALQKNPGDEDNRRKLDALAGTVQYTPGMNDNSRRDQIVAAVKKDSMDNAVSLIEWAYQKDKKNISLANQLAHYLVENDQTETGAARALQIYAIFTSSDDKPLRYSALLLKGEFLHRLILNPSAFDKLRSAGLVKASNPRDEAVAVLTEALDQQPADHNEALRYLADLYFDISRWPEAQSTYAKVLEQEKEPTIRERVVRRYIETEIRLDIPENPKDRVNFKDALARLEEALKKDPKDMQALTLRAFAAIRQSGVEKDPDPKKQADARRQLVREAIGYLDRALQVDSANSDALYYRAMANIQLGGERLNEAVRDLLIASKNDRMAVNSRVLLADIYRRSLRYEEAAAEYRELMELHPDLLNVRQDYIEFLMSAARLQRTLPSDSGEEFVLAVRRLDPENKIFDQIRTASELFPAQQVRWLLIYGQFLDLQEKYDQARRVFQSLYDQKELQNQAQVIDAYLGSLNKVPDYPKAIEVAGPVLSAGDKFFGDHPEWVGLYLHRAAAYQATGKQAEAVADLDKAFGYAAGAAKSGNISPFIAVLGQSSQILPPQLVADRLRARLAANPSELISKIGLMQVLMQMKQTAEALKVCQETVPPADNLALKAMVLRVSAMARFQAGKYSEAEKDFMALFDIADKDVESLNNYAFMLTDAMKKPDQGVVYAKKALQVLNTEAYEAHVSAASASVYDTLGWSLLRSNDAKGAVAALQVSVNTQPMSEALYHLALAYEKDGRKDEAQLKCAEGIKFAMTRKDDVLPDLAKLGDRFGAELTQKSDYSRAIEILQLSVKAVPTSEAYYHLAVACDKAGRTPEARVACAEGVKLATSRKDDVLPDLLKLQDKLTP